MLKPLGDCILVVVRNKERVTEGGIIIPATVEKDKNCYADVLEVSDGVWKKGKLCPLPFKKGDVVYMNGFAGTRVTLEGRECLMVHEEDVIGIAE